jgi:hypothetical protein
MWVTRFFIVCWANVFIIVSVVILTRSIFARENRMIKHRGATTSSTDETSRKRKVIWQGIWYILAFEISWGAWYAFQFIRISADKRMNSTKFYNVDVSAILYVWALTHPTQGMSKIFLSREPLFCHIEATHVMIHLRCILQKIIRRLDFNGIFSAAVPKIPSKRSQ